MEEHSFLRYSLAVLLFLAISTQGQQIDPHYDRPESKLKVLELRHPLVLFCEWTDPSSSKHELEWTKNGVAVGSDPALAGRHSILQAEKKLVIDRALEGDAGNYTCTIKGTRISASYRVITNVVAKMVANAAVIEEERFQLHCIVSGTDPEVQWTIQDNITIVDSHGRYILKEDDNKIKNAILVINEAQLSDRGNYTCEASNEATKTFDKHKTASRTCYLRVKGKFAALWPFLGICAEVIVLCAIILIYEKRRNKADLEESDTDQSPEQKSDHKESEVRQRK